MKLFKRYGFLIYYVKKGNVQFKVDKNGPLIVDHDLHNHHGELLDETTEAFFEFAKSEHLSFWKQEEQ